MDEKLLILCDELPGDYDEYSIKDVYYLRDMMYDPEDDSNQIFVSWDAIIPKDQSFIEQCRYYGTTYEQMPGDFRLKQTGAVDSRNCNIKSSLQEESYMKALDSNLGYISEIYKRGEDARAIGLDLAVQFPMQAAQQFFEDFSAMLNRNGVVRILTAHSDKLSSDVIAYRMQLLDSWKNQNAFMRENASSAELLEPMLYSDFAKVHFRAGKELMKIYSLPMFGEEDDRSRRYV